MLYGTKTERKMEMEECMLKHIYIHRDKLLGNSNCKLEKNKLKKYEIAKLSILMLE